MTCVMQCRICGNDFKTTSTKKYIRQYPDLCRFCTQQAAAKFRYSKYLFDRSVVCYDIDTFVVTDRAGIKLSGKEKFDFPCQKCGKVYQTALNYERKKKYSWHCKSCAIKREWNENEDYHSNHQSALKISNSTPERKIAVGIVSKTNWSDPKIRSAMLDRDMIAAAQKGRETLQQNLLSGITKMKSSHGKGAWYGAHYMRSTYETRFAAFLDQHEYMWDYESKAYAVLDGTKTYTPDFDIVGLGLVEVKGWWRDDAKEKYDDFVSQRLQRIILVQKAELIALEKGTVTLEDLFNQAS